MTTEDTEKLPIVADDFTFSVRGGVLHISFFARLAPYASQGIQDEERVCVSRIAVGPEMTKGMVEGLQKVIPVLKSGKLELVN